MVTFEETNQTLQTSDLVDTCDLVAVMIYSEILFGASWKLVFMNAVQVVESLVGATGDTLCVATLGRGEFTARAISESSLDTSGFTKDKLSPSTVTIEIGDIVYNATRISDVLKEDSTLDWARAALFKIGESIGYRIDCDIRDALVGACTEVGGNVVTASVRGTLSYDDVVDAGVILENNGYWSEDGHLLFINPEQKGDLVKDTRFTDTARYSTAKVPLAGEIGKFASAIVFVTDIPLEWDSEVKYSLLVASPTNRYGPAAMFAWKRHMKQESWRDEQYGRDVHLMSCRYGVEVTFADAVAMISDT